VAAQLAASQEGLSSMELVRYLRMWYITVIMAWFREWDSVSD
jgi:hypothetical protein